MEYLFIPQKCGSWRRYKTDVIVEGLRKGAMGNRQWAIGNKQKVIWAILVL